MDEQLKAFEARMKEMIEDATEAAHFVPLLTELLGIVMTQAAELDGVREGARRTAGLLACVLSLKHNGTVELPVEGVMEATEQEGAVLAKFSQDNKSVTVTLLRSTDMPPGNVH